MPTAALRPCVRPGCRALVRKGTCDAHDRRKRWSTDGVSRQARGYGAGWERIRARVLAEEPACQIRSRCDGAPSTTVDHIIPKAEGGTGERSNLRGVCKACQQSKAGSEGARGRKRRAA